MNKSEKIEKYIKKHKKNGYVGITARALSEKIGCSEALVKTVAKNMGISFTRKKREYTHERSDGCAKKIIKMIKKDPGITYREIGERLGVSKQWIFTVAKEYGISKYMAPIRNSTEEKIKKAIAGINKDIYLTLFLRENSINVKAYKKYSLLHANDPDFKRFAKHILPVAAKKKAVINYLNEGKLSSKEIAEKCGTSYPYVWRIKKEIEEKEYER